MNFKAVFSRIKVFLIGLVVLLLIYPAAFLLSIDTITLKVKDKERITIGKGADVNSKFIIYGQDEVFENTDALLFMKFNSADFQNQLDPGKTYQVRVAGYRVPLFSWYRNIVKVM